MDHAQLIARACELRPLSVTATRVLGLARDPRADWDRIGDVIESDPALASQVLRAVSTPAYQRRFAPPDLRSACRVLGQRELYDLVASYALLGAYASNHEIAVRAHRVGALAAQLASRTAEMLQLRGGSNAFLAGLLCELGALACASVDGETYVGLRRGCVDEPARILAEVKRYRASSFAIGAALLGVHGLSAPIARAVHGADNDPLSTVVRFARRAATTMLISFDAHELDWFDAIERLGAREGLVLEPHELEVAAAEAYFSTQRRFADMAV